MWVVETGEGLSNSASYSGTRDFDGYTSMRHGFEYLHVSDGCIFSKDQKLKALVSASDMLDSLTWSGCRARGSQAMEWPRRGACSTCNGYTGVPCDIIPKEIKDATIILAALILKGEISVSTNEKSYRVSEMSMDKMSIKFKSGAHISDDGGCGGVMTKSGDRFHAVRHLIKCYLDSNNISKIIFMRGA